MKKLNQTLLLVLCIALVMMPTVMAATDTTDSSSSSSTTINYGDWFNPGRGINTVKDSPIGNPLMKFIDLVVGLVILYGFLKILQHFIKSKSDNGESASDGYIGMGTITIGALVMVACVAMYFYFFGYQL